MGERGHVGQRGVLAAVVVVLGQVAVGELTGLVDLCRERVGAAGVPSAIHTTMIPIDSYHDARDES